MPMKFMKCGCDGSRWMRTERSPWMHAFFFMRLYYCAACSCYVFALKKLRSRVHSH